ncbi:hypothetical protein [Eubacterium sp.]
MKKEYMSPEMEIIEFDTNDVISTSGEDALIDINVDKNYFNNQNDWSGFY